MNRPHDPKLERKCRSQSGARSAIAMMCAVAIGLGVATTPKPAKASVLVVIEAAVLIYEAISIGAELLSGEDHGPDVAAQIAAAEGRIVEWMRTSRNQALASDVHGAVTLFGHLLNYDVDNPLERAEAGDWWNSSWHTFLVVEPRLRDIMNSSDVESAYDLAPFYTLLVATGAGMLHAKREVLTPSHWSMFHAWLQPAVNTNYNQIKARRHECWNGTGPNPGHFEDSGMREVQYFLNTAREGKWQSSKFFKKIANQNFRTYKKEGHSWSMNPALCFPTTYHHKCNPQTGACTTEPFWCGGIHPQPRVTLRKCATNLTDLVCAQKQAEEAFRNDEVVRSIGESQDKIMRLSGGNDGAPDSENDLFLFHGRVVDPWVNEGSCASGFAYPQEPL